MKTLFWVGRHGTTDDTKKNIFRGDRNSKLDRKGFNDAHELKAFFQDKGWARIVISEMDRAHQTADVIADGDESKIIGPASAVNPWSIGYLAGKDKTQYEPDMQVFIDHPDMRPQGGETLDEFRARVTPVLVRLIELGLQGQRNILIGHSSIIHALSDLLMEPGQELDVKPGGVIEVYVDNKGRVLGRVVYKPGDDDSSFGKGTTS